VKVKASNREKAGDPLEVASVDLEGAKAGEVLVEIKRPESVTPTPTLCRAPIPRACSPVSLGHEGRRRRRRDGARRDDPERDDHVIPLYIPECRNCPACLSGKTNLCTAIRETQGRGVMPDGHQPVLARRPTAASLYGDLDLREFHRRAGDSAGESSRRRAVRKDLLHRMRRHHRNRRRAQHRKGPGRRPGGRVRARRHRSQT